MKHPQTGICREGCPFLALVAFSALLFALLGLWLPALAFRAEVLQAHTEIRDIVRRYAGKNQKGSTVAQQLDARKPKK